MGSQGSSVERRRGIGFICSGYLHERGNKEGRAGRLADFNDHVVVEACRSNASPTYTEARRNYSSAAANLWFLDWPPSTSPRSATQYKFRNHAMSSCYQLSFPINTRIHIFMLRLSSQV